MPSGHGTDMPSNCGTAVPSGRGTVRRNMSPGDAVRSPGRNAVRRPDDGTGTGQPPGEDEWSPGRDVIRPDGEMRPPGGLERSPGRNDGPLGRGGPGISGLSGHDTNAHSRKDGSPGHGRGNNLNASTDSDSDEYY